MKQRIVFRHPDARTRRSLWTATGEHLVIVRDTLHAAREVHHTVFAVAREDRVDVVHHTGWCGPRRDATGGREERLAGPPFPPGLRVSRGRWRNPILEWQLGTPALGLHADLRFEMRRDPDRAEPRPGIEGEWTERELDRIQTGAARGEVRLDGRTFAVDRLACLGRTQQGVAPFDGPPAPMTRPPDPLPQRLWFHASLFHDRPVGVTIKEDEHGTRVHTAVLDAGGPEAPGALALSWRPGTRQLARATLHDFPHAGERLTLTPIITVPSALLGGLGADWPLGAWVGDDATARRSQPLDEPLPELAGVEHEHLCAVEGLPGCTRAIVEVTALGPHEPSGLTGWTDPP